MQKLSGPAAAAVERRRAQGELGLASCVATEAATRPHAMTGQVPMRALTNMLPTLFKRIRGCVLLIIKSSKDGCAGYSGQPVSITCTGMLLAVWGPMHGQAGVRNKQ